jgi:hypothetical protein
LFRFSACCHIRFLSFRLIQIALPAWNNLKKFTPKEPGTETRISHALLKWMQKMPAPLHIEAKKEGIED